MHVQQEVHLAGASCSRPPPRPVDERAPEPFDDLVGVLLQLDLHDGLDGLPAPLRVDDGRITLDEPAASSWRMRRAQGVGDRPTCSARSVTLMRPSRCSTSGFVDPSCRASYLESYLHFALYVVKCAHNAAFPDRNSHFSVRDAGMMRAMRSITRRPTSRP
jgi:hypothetical protein